MEPRPWFLSLSAEEVEASVQGGTDAVSDEVIRLMRAWDAHWEAYAAQAGIQRGLAVLGGRSPIEDKLMLLMAEWYVRRVLDKKGGRALVEKQIRKGRRRNRRR
jgi:hypothetical protein